MKDTGQSLLTTGPQRYQSSRHDMGSKRDVSRDGKTTSTHVFPQSVSTETTSQERHELIHHGTKPARTDWHLSLTQYLQAWNSRTMSGSSNSRKLDRSGNARTHLRKVQLPVGLSACRRKSCASFAASLGVATNEAAVSATSGCTTPFACRLSFTHSSVTQKMKSASLT